MFFDPPMSLGHEVLGGSAVETNYEAPSFRVVAKARLGLYPGWIGNAPYDEYITMKQGNSFGNAPNEQFFNPDLLPADYYEQEWNSGKLDPGNIDPVEFKTLEY